MSSICKITITLDKTIRVISNTSALLPFHKYYVDDQIEQELIFILIIIRVFVITISGVWYYSLFMISQYRKILVISSPSTT